MPTILRVAIALIIIAAPARAHEHWINQRQLNDPQTGQWCCNKNDCAETAVKETTGGYTIVETGEFWPHARVIWQSPGGWWRCRHLTDSYTGGPAGSTRCLIGAPPGS